MTRLDGSTLGGSTRQEPPECNVFIADWIPVLTRAALTA